MPALALTRGRRSASAGRESSTAETIENRNLMLVSQ